jgi:hypothetical protein
MFDPYVPSPPGQFAGNEVVDALAGATVVRIAIVDEESKRSIAVSVA